MNGTNAMASSIAAKGRIIKTCGSGTLAAWRMLRMRGREAAGSVLGEASITARTDDSIPQGVGCFGLRLIQSHQPRLFQFLHRCEVKPIQGTAISRLRMP